MKAYEFTITMTGDGENPQEAWIDACIGLVEDGGEAPSDYKVIDDDVCGEKNEANDWALCEAVEQEWEQDDSGVYTIINRASSLWIEGIIHRVRVDIMSSQDNPIISFVGDPENLRKNVMKFLGRYNVSLEHASYIGSEIAKASILEDYVQS